MRVGPNDLQNSPVMTAVVAGTKGAVQASLSSLPNTPFLIQFFSSATPDPIRLRPGPDAAGLAGDHDRLRAALALVSLTPAGRRSGEHVGERHRHQSDSPATPRNSRRISRRSR